MSAKDEARGPAMTDGGAEGVGVHIAGQHGRGMPARAQAKLWSTQRARVAARTMPGLCSASASRHAASSAGLAMGWGVTKLKGGGSKQGFSLASLARHRTLARRLALPVSM